MEMTTDLSSIEHDNQTKLEAYYNGRKLRRYLQLLEPSEQVCRSSTTNAAAKKVAKGFADHYRRMVICIVMKPFDPNEIETDNMNELMFVGEVARLNRLFDPKFDIGTGKQ